MHTCLVPVTGHIVPDEHPKGFDAPLVASFIVDAGRACVHWQKNTRGVRSDGLWVCRVRDANGVDRNIAATPDSWRAAGIGSYHQP